MKHQPVIVVHGGAGSLPSEADRREYLRGVNEALDAGLAALSDGAATAVREAVAWLEAHTITNAGQGAALAADGSVRLDAGFMEGATRRYGGVTGVRACIHPVRLAERLMHDGPYGRLLGPPDVDALAASMGLALDDPESLVTDRTRRLFEQRREQDPAAGSTAWLDTVGAVALDAEGHVAAAVSTGGMSLKRPGRIGDSPIVGAGFWADDRMGACVTTGVGEVLLRQGVARRCVQLVGAGQSAAGAAEAALAEIVDYPDDRRGPSGLVLVTRDGEVALDHNSDEMSGGWARPDGQREVHHLWRGR